MSSPFDTSIWVGIVSGVASLFAGALALLHTSSVRRTDDLKAELEKKVSEEIFFERTNNILGIVDNLANKTEQQQEAIISTNEAIIRMDSNIAHLAEN